MPRISKYPTSAGVYKLTCLITNKIYIGKAFNIRNRLNNHKHIGRYKKAKYHLPRAIAKYGWDNFSVEILEIMDNFDKLKDNNFLLKREAYYIELFDSTNQDKGYNILKFSTDRTGMKTVHTPETKEKMRQAALGRKHSEETKEKIRNNKLGLKHSEETKEKIRQGNKGKIVSEETRKKLSIANMGNYKSEEAKQKWRESFSGYKHSEKTIQKMKDSHARRLRDKSTNFEI